MKPFHVPAVNARYWVAITLASVFGTNMGDLYAHESGLGIWRGLLLLAALAAAAFLLERRDATRHEAWYWLVIIIIRTGATNIADFLAFRVRVPAIGLATGLCVLLAALAWYSHRLSRQAGAEGERKLPSTDAIYWFAMLTAGVLGTVLGDDASHLVGEGPASLGLLVLVVAALAATKGSGAALLYWPVVGIARTAGTSVGDFLAESRALAIGLPLATLLSGLAFVLIVTLWRGRSQARPEGEGTTEARHATRR